MAILGTGGKLKLRREAPDPVVVGVSSVNATNNTVSAGTTFWSGDEVRLTSSRGLPFDVDGSLSGPDCPDGHGIYYGGSYLLGSNRSHTTSSSDPFYSSTNTNQFYLRSTDVGLTTSYDFYAHLDQVGRLSFYSSRAQALLGATSDRIDIFAVDFGQLEIQAVVTEDDWYIQSLLREWSLNLTAPEVDTTGVGEKFGDSVKSVVSGGGSLDFIVDRKSTPNEQDPTALMNLLLMTEKGCTADAEFWMITDRTATADLLPGDLYYETQLMVTSMAINTRPDEIIAGSLNFVTVGDISLRMGQG
jgi:hypothetical protein